MTPDHCHKGCHHGAMKTRTDLLFMIQIEPQAEVVGLELSPLHLSEVGWRNTLGALSDPLLAQESTNVLEASWPPSWRRGAKTGEMIDTFVIQNGEIEDEATVPLEGPAAAIHLTNERLIASDTRMTFPIPLRISHRLETATSHLGPSER